jgi:DNA polymerase elongation subunit (family B)
MNLLKVRFLNINLIKMEKTIFAYSWHQTDDNNKNWSNSKESLRIYGITDEGKTTCLIINDFKPFVHVELPIHINWRQKIDGKAKVQKIMDYLNLILGNMGPVKGRTIFIDKYKLYGSHYTQESEGVFKKKSFPYIVMFFESRKHIKNLELKLKNHIDVLGFGRLKLNVREANISPILQLCVERNLPSAGWIGFKVEGAGITGNAKGIGELIENDKKFTDCDEEYTISKNCIYPADKQSPVKAKIMAWDIEAYSKDGKFPDGTKPSNVVFQISCVFFIVGSCKKKKYILTLGDPSESLIERDIIIRKFKSEEELLIGFAMLQKEEKPHLTTGWNIFQFDITFLLKRAKLHRCLPNFLLQGFPREQFGKEKEVKWQSKAYGTTDLKFIDCEGVLSIDLMDVVQKEHKLDNYSLNFVSKYFLGTKKDDLDHEDIFLCYKQGMKQKKGGGFTDAAKNAMAKVGNYCVQDSVLVADLFEHLQIWLSFTEMSRTCTTPIMTIHVQGQQVKFFNQVYKYCYEHKIVTDKETYTVNEKEKYRGAEVFDPIPGLKLNVVPLDFSSLYPSLIIAKNMDYSTFVDNDMIPDEMCHVMKWDDHVACEHDPKVIRKKAITDELEKLKEKNVNGGNKNDIKKQISELISERSNITKKLSKNVMCVSNRHYRFLKEPKGILPTIIQNLLDARKKTREEIKQLGYKLKQLKTKDHKTENDIRDIFGIENLLPILDKRQNSYKISANSMYGATGVKVGALPFMPIAMCTTYMGRKSILEVSEYLKELGGEVVYGDTDCLHRESPVLIKNENGEQFFTTVDDLSQEDWKQINPKKEISTPKHGYEIWSDRGFTKIENVVRCIPDEPLSRVTTHVGSVICSNNHSLLTDYLTSITPDDVEIGDKLCTSEFPLPEDTPKRPMYSNKLTVEKIQQYEISNFKHNDITSKIAFVWGLFFADGGAGVYSSRILLSGKTYTNYTWAINKTDLVLLERVRLILEEIYGKPFKVLDTIKSSKCYKLVPCIIDKDMVKSYYNMFYHKKEKRIPNIILQSPVEIRQSFFMGYYAGDGSKKDPAISLSNKGQLGSAQLFYLMRSIGYNVTVNVRDDKPEIYKLTGSTPAMKQRKVPNAIKKISTYNNDDYIYDIQTSNHHFAAGVGQLVVHNSNYVTFDGVVDKNVKIGTEEFKTEMKKLWNHSIEVAKEISKKFENPITLEFENAIYFKFLILTKKRYMYYSCGEDGTIVKDNAGIPKMGRRGVILSRRDNCKFMKDVYRNVIDKIFNEVDCDKILNGVVEQVIDLYTRKIEFDSKVEKDDTYLKNLVVTKSVGDYGGENSTFTPILGKNDKGEDKWKIGNYIVPLITDDIVRGMSEDDIKEWYLERLPAQVQLEVKVRRRGHAKEEGQRLSYVVTDVGFKGKQSEKIEAVDYFKRHSRVLKLDYGYYLERLIEPLDQVFQAVFQDKRRYREKTEYSKRFQKTKLFLLFSEKKYNDSKHFTLNLQKFCSVTKPKLLNEITSFSKPNLMLVV